MCYNNTHNTEVEIVNMIEDYAKETIDWSFFFMDIGFNKDNAPQDICEDIDFLINRFNFEYSDNLYQKNPFVPMAYFKNIGRSVDVSDLTADDIARLKTVLTKTENPILQGKIYDVLGIVENTKANSIKAADIYVEYAINKLHIEENYKVTKPLCRALYIYSFTKQKKVMSDVLDEFILNTDYGNDDKELVVKYYLVEFCTKNNIKLKNEYIESLELTVSKSDKPDQPRLELIETIIKFYKACQNTKKVKKWKKKYTYICELANTNYPRDGYRFLQKALDILDFDEDSEEYNRISFLRDEAQQKMYDSFERVNVPFSQENILYKHYKEMESLFKQRLNGTQQFMLFLECFRPITKKELKKALNYKDSMLGARLFNNIFFDKNKRIVYESTKADAVEKEEYEIADSIRLHNSVICSLFIGAWNSCKIIDDDLKLLIQDIVWHNYLIPKPRCREVYNSLIDGLQNNYIRKAVYELISQFEEGCRQFLYQYRKIYPRVKVGKKTDTYSANLNNFLVEKGNKHNRFRKEIAELIGEDLTLTIEYLACRKLSGNLRNEYYHHGHGDTNKFSLDEASLFYFLIKAYCMGYDETINANI